MSGRGLYRPCVGVLLLNAQGLAFIGRRRAKGAHDQTRPPYLWQMPQGGIDEGETPYEAALRELYEETNVSSVALLGEAPDWLCYDLPRNNNNRWSGKYVGQTQRWFALRFTGDESEIDIHAPGHGAHKPEFDAWRWEALSALPDLIVPFKRLVYEQVVKEFTPLTAARA
ncbi:RNA pyrophosphohydrolase [Methylocystis suflitae]|uniref:RNA pyrophosphohydrolase n=1 Tax=Methylocystis suflitae TaxID=2951405 RepID=UPI0021095981|nr:RNA pyrophosphohydrolase [Methylocystis suflitae]MCQ4190175.1 RNA pyrophosphohydrolase [Methylocystis suflitae]